MDDGVDYLVAYALSHGLDLLVPGGSRGNLAFCYEGPHPGRLTSRIMAGAYLKAPCLRCVSNGTLWAVGGPCVDRTRFHEGRGARKSTTPGGHIIVSEKE